MESLFTLSRFSSFQRMCVSLSHAVDSVSHYIAKSQSKPTVALHQFSTPVLGMYTWQVKSKSVFVHPHTAGFQWAKKQKQTSNRISHCHVSGAGGGGAGGAGVGE